MWRAFSRPSTTPKSSLLISRSSAVHVLAEVLLTSRLDPSVSQMHAREIWRDVKKYQRVPSHQPGHFIGKYHLAAGRMHQDGILIVFVLVFKDGPMPFNLLLGKSNETLLH